MLTRFRNTLIVSTLLFLAATTAQSQTVPPSVVAYQKIGQAAPTDDGFFQVSSEASVLIALRINRRYVCELTVRNADSTAVLSTTVYRPNYFLSGVGGGLGYLTTEAIHNGRMHPAMPIGSAGVDPDNRRIVFTAGLNVPTATINPHYIVVTSAGSGEYVKVICNETDLFGGFNTYVNNFNFLELENMSDADLEVQIVLSNTTANLGTVTIPASSRVDVDLHTPAGSNNYGLVRVLHNGPLGAIRGRTSFYTGTVSSFALTGTRELAPIEQ